MNPIEALLARAGECGFAVELADGAPRLVPVREGARCPEGLLVGLRRHREAIVALLRCGECGRESCQREDRERLRDPLHCDRASCPYKRNRQ